MRSLEQTDLVFCLHGPFSVWNSGAASCFFLLFLFFEEGSQSGGGLPKYLLQFWPWSVCRVICAVEATCSVVWCLCCGNLVGEEVTRVFVNRWSSAWRAHQRKRTLRQVRESVELLGIVAVGPSWFLLPFFILPSLSISSPRWKLHFWIPVKLQNWPEKTWVLPGFEWAVCVLFCGAHNVVGETLLKESRWKKWHIKWWLSWHVLWSLYTPDFRLYHSLCTGMNAHVPSRVPVLWKVYENTATR